MIEFLGWATFVLGGAVVAALVIMRAYLGIICRDGGGLEDVGAALFFAGLSALIWIGYALWLSPLTIAVN